MPKIMLNSVEYTGGGGDSGMELTYDEYLALPEEEKTNGTTYYIKDINGVGNDQFQPIIYSEEEREIGVWIDGRPLYEKTVTFTNVSRTGVIDLDLINVDNIFIHNGQYDQDLPLPYVHSDMGNGIGGFFGTDSNGKRIWNVRGGSYAPSVTGWITVRYTKTTDTPGSGIWTPQGVPAIHYSTDEQVVGTWVDGNTLYEKTIKKQNISSTSSSTILIPSSELTGMNIIEIGGSYVSRTSNSTYNINTYINSSTITATWLAEDNIYYWLYWGAADTYDAYITIRYTKQTS